MNTKASKRIRSKYTHQSKKARMGSKGPAMLFNLASIICFLLFLSIADGRLFAGCKSLKYLYSCTEQLVLFFTSP